MAMATKTANVGFTCLKCETPVHFPNEKKLQFHAYNYHNDITVECDAQTFEIKRDENDALKCPLCEHVSMTATGLRSHVQRKHVSSSAKECSDDDNDPESDTDVETMQVPPLIMPILIVPPVPRATEPISSRRGYDDAVLHACQQSDAEDKAKTLWIIDRLHLEPFSMVNADGVEEIGLSHKSNVSKIVDQPPHVAFSRIVPVKRKWDCVDQDDAATSNMDPTLLNVMLKGSFRAALLNRKFVEVTDELCDILNEDWWMKPQMKYCCAQMFAGALLLHENRKHGIIINCAEVYGRTKTVDAHRENFTNKKGRPPPSSLPPRRTRYKNTWPVTIEDGEGPKLVIGTKSCNVLVTSSLRIDCTLQANVGASTPSFVLKTPTDSLSTRISFDEESIEKTFKLVKDPTANALSKHDTLYQLRQIRSKFHQISSYFLCRSSSIFADDHRCRPYTIFTYCDYDNGDTNSSKVVSLLFKKMATSVISSESLVMKKKDVEDCLQHCTDAAMKNSCEAILQLFPANRHEIHILGNVALNKQLKKLAEAISSTVNKANASVAETIMDVFSNQ